MESELKKVEERLSYQGRFHLGSLFFIPLTSTFFIQFSEYIFGVNNSIKTIIQVLVLFVFLYLGIYFGFRAEKYNKLASNIKCLSKTVKQVLDNSPQDR